MFWFYITVAFILSAIATLFMIFLMVEDASDPDDRKEILGAWSLALIVSWLWPVILVAAVPTLFVYGLFQIPRFIRVVRSVG